MSSPDSHLHGGGSRPPAERPVSALPSRQARALAFGAIVVAGICGGLIGYSFVSIQCHGSCSTPEGTGAIVGAVIAAVGVAVVAVLVLRAMGEWKTITQQRALEEADRAAAEHLATTDPSEDTPDTDPTP